MSEEEEEKILQAFRIAFGPFETYRNHQAWKAALAAFTSGWKAHKKQREDGSAAPSTALSDNGGLPPNPQNED